MRYRDIRRYLKPYSMVSSRTTTINHAFAASIAPNDNYDEEKIRGALIVLGQDAVPEHLPEYQQLQEIRDQVIALLRKADGLAKIVREKSTGAQIG